MHASNAAGLSASAADRIVGIYANGKAAYVLDALAYARSVGCVMIGVTSGKDSRIAKKADIAIVTDTGPEAITGSARMKAGSAHNMVLNMLSACAMVKTGKLCENLMIDLKPTNIKLRRRVIYTVRELAGYTEEKTIEGLGKYNWVIRDAVDNKSK